MSRSITIAKRTTAVLAISALAMVVFFSQPSGATGMSQDDTGKIYKAKCAMCHSADGSGNSPMGKTLKIRDLRSPDVQKQSDAQLSEIISKGKAKCRGLKRA